MASEGLMGGLFVKRTPREYIEGYNDPVITDIAKQPLYKGGDRTTSPFLSILTTKLTPPNTTVALFSGIDDYMMTRRYGLW
jgi:hypothetical protein